MNESNLEKRYFISYAREDIDIARRIREDLKSRDVKVWMDKDDIPGGTRWDDFIEKSIEQSIAVFYLVSPASGSSPNVRHEIDFAKKYRKTIFPLWIEGDTEEWSSYVHFGLSSLQYIDLRGETYATGIAKLTQTLLKKEMSGGAREAAPHNPYKGLHAFEYEDAWSFYGRGNQVSEIVQHVEAILNEEHEAKEHQDIRVSRCMMVKGASGSGKSSLVMAGLLPALENEENIPEVKRWFFLKPVRPGEHPMNALAQMLNLPFLNREKVGDSPLEKKSLADLRETLDEPGGLDKLLREITNISGERIVLIVDQFEEIFALTVDSGRRDQFIKLLMAAATEPATPLLLLFTLRVDFYDHVINNADIYKNVKHHQIDIPNMTSEELRLVINKPAQHKAVKVEFDPNLAEDLLHEIREHPESLPLLQFTLDQLFKHREGRLLTRQSYEEMGKLQGAINKHADDIYKHELDTPEHKAEAERLFTEYFIYVAEAHGEPSHLEAGEGITRRRVTRTELKLDDPQFRVRSKTIDAFIDARLLTTTSVVRQSTDSENEDVTEIAYEISHEALINAWEKFQTWIKKNRKDIYLVQSLRPRIREWEQEENQKRKKEHLLIDKLVLQQLREYSKQKELDSSAREFLQASLAQQKNQYIQRFLLTTAVVILSLVLGLFIRNVLFPDPTIVTSSAEFGPGTLAYALQRASDGATITFDTSLTGKTIYLTDGVLDINKSVAIHGPVGGINISSGGPKGNYISIKSVYTVTIENVTFTNSYTLKHSMIENAGNLTINKSKLISNKTYNNGGVINNKGNLILNDDEIKKNTASGNGGAIYNIYGIISINNSDISDNEAYDNGGGIYSQGGVVTVGGSRISNNNADNNAGGGIAILNGSLSMSDTQIDHNHSNNAKGSIGGGIAIEGSIAFIANSVITANTADAKGGGIAVMKDTDNNSSGLVTLQGIIHTDDSTARYYIGKNEIEQNLADGNNDKDIAGDVTTIGTDLRISDDMSIDRLGNPPGSNPPQELPNYLGVANINTFCLSKGTSYGRISTNMDRNATDILFTCFNQSNKPVGADFTGKTICQIQYPEIPENTVIDRMANYFDPTSLQCYKNLKLLGPIGQTGFANYCANQPQYTGLFDNSPYRSTAYDWLCQPKDNSKLPSGLSVADACNLQYNNNSQYDRKKVIDRLANFNTPNGWECWLAE